jgi:hypothetical protein
LRHVAFVQLVNRKIGDQNTGVFGRLPPEIFWDVSNREIDWIGRLSSSELCKLCFVGGDDDGCNGSVGEARFSN